MPRWVDETCEFLLTWWNEATVATYVVLAVLIVLAGWLVRRNSPN